MGLAEEAERYPWVRCLAGEAGRGAAPPMSDGQSQNVETPGQASGLFLEFVHFQVGWMGLWGGPPGPQPAPWPALESTENLNPRALFKTIAA